jgi:hypothetical protein
VCSMGVNCEHLVNRWLSAENYIFINMFSAVVVLWKTRNDIQF